MGGNVFSIICFKASHLNPLKNEIDLSYTYKFRSYRVVNTLLLCYKNEQVNII
jgi:hypothetical protein